jgi:hypothetical protein
VLQTRALACPPETPFALRWRDHPHRHVQGPQIAYVRIESGRGPIRLDVVDDGIVATAAMIRPELRLDDSFASQLIAARRLYRLLTKQPLDPDEDKRLPALVLALRALDARRQGCGLREIALSLLGLTDWPGKGDWVKSRARRLVDLAGRMEQAGPRGVLRREI